MPDDRLAYKRIAAGIKLKKVLIVAAFVVVCVLTVLFLGDFHYNNGLEQIGVGLSLHPLIVLAAALLEAVFAVILFSRAEKSADPILEDECDPLLYFQVRKAFMSSKDQNTTLPILEAQVTYYLGDFAKCERVSSQIANFSGSADRLYGMSLLGFSSFFLGDRKTLSKVTHDFERLLERSGLKMRSPIRKDMDRRQRMLTMLDSSLRADAATALQFADSLFTDTTDTSRIERLNVLYLRAVVYEKFGEVKKSRQCIDQCREIDNKTFIGERIRNE